MTQTAKIREAYDQGAGVLRLAPVFVPRRFNQAGRRLRLHPNDYYALGAARGSIKERWFSSVTPAMNGPLAPPDEGMSYVAPSDRKEEIFLFKEAVLELGEALIGSDLWAQYGTWPMYSKFFDYEAPLFHHLHLTDSTAGRVGRFGKPEAYYFPHQLNNHLGQFPVTFFGYDPDMTQEMVKERLLMYESGDNRITELSRAYRIELGTGWYTPAGVVHAPGSVLTYEPQWNSDVNSVHENVTAGEVNPVNFLNENCPVDQKENIDYIMSLMDWETNIDPHYKKHYFRPPLQAQIDGGFEEKWITYATPYFSAKELTIEPGATVTVRDGAAYGCIIIQGYGKFGVFDAEAAIMLRYGQLSADEYFVSAPAARDGVRITNNSKIEPMVILKHFGPNHPDMPRQVS
jgi:hypothetical protein